MGANDLIDLLFKRADSAQKPEEIARYLFEAREKVEMLKVVELQLKYGTPNGSKKKKLDLIEIAEGSIPECEQ